MDTLRPVQSSRARDHAMAPRSAVSDNPDPETHTIFVDVIQIRTRDRKLAAGTLCGAFRSVFPRFKYVFGSDVLTKILDRSCEFNGHRRKASRPFDRLVADRRWSGVRINTCHHTPREDSRCLSKPTIIDYHLAPNRRLHRSLFHRCS